MKLEFENNKLHVYREPGDPKYYGIINAAGESRLLHTIKKQLNAKGWTLIKKRMWKDGHLKDELQQYLRTRKPTGDPNKDVYIYNPYWAIQGAEVDFNVGHLILAVERGVFGETQQKRT
jgi:hypothetical protein